jgi:hypothetical protein
VGGGYSYSIPAQLCAASTLSRFQSTSRNSRHRDNLGAPSEAAFTVGTLIQASAITVSDASPTAYNGKWTVVFVSAASVVVFMRSNPGTYASRYVISHLYQQALIITAATGVRLHIEERLR